MKKLLVVLCVLLLASCSSKEPETIGGNVVNPNVEYASLDEINDIVGSKLFKMPTMGVDNESFIVINNEVAQYCFTLNGYEYTFRAAKDDGHDISGVYGEDGLIFEDDKNSYGYYLGNDRKDFFYVVSDYRYNLDVEDGGALDSEQFYAISDEVFNILSETYANPALLELVASYADSVSQRATMEVTLASEKSVLIEITWSSSALEYDFFSMEAVLNNDKLEYEMGAHYRVSDGNIENAIFFTDYAKGGYFTLKDNKLLWNGSGQENTDACVFEKIEY